MPNFLRLVQLLEFIGSALSLDNQHEYDANPDSVETFSVLIVITQRTPLIEEERCRSSFFFLFVKTCS